MACRQCGSLRLVLNDRIACPKCEKIILGDRPRTMRDISVQLLDASRRMTVLLKHCGKSDVLNFAMNAREVAAKRLLSDPANVDFARNWVAASYLLVHTDSCSGPKEAVLPFELLSASKEVIWLDDRLEALRNNNLDVLDDGTFVWTEKEKLQQIPSSVLQAITAEIGEGWTALEGMEKMVGADILYPVREVIESETLSRSLSRAFHRRLAPDLNSASKATDFSEISLNLAALIAFILGSEFKTANGILRASDQRFGFIKRELEREFDETRVAWFFSLMGKNVGSEMEGLAYSTVLRDSSAQLTFLPYHSLYMLSISSYKYTDAKSIGKAWNYKGRAVENVLFNAVTSCLQTRHPMDGRKLLRYQLPDDKGDIDVAGFDKSNLLLMESKFWDSPTVESLESELDRFKLRVDYVQQNLSKLGFDEGLKITPVFFTPYAPLAMWSQIRLLPSVSSIIYFLTKNFGPRRFRLIDGDERISQYVQMDNNGRFIPLDGSGVASDISEDLYRIQDGVVDQLGDNEIVVYVMTPAGTAYPIFCELTQPMALDLRTSGVGPGTVIRMGLYNLLGGWAPAQLCCFRVLKSFEETKGQSPAMVLTLANVSSARDEFVLRTWGEYGKEILDFAEKWDVDLFKLITRLEQKGQNYLSGVGIALGLQDMFHFVAQCPCGDAIGMPTTLAVRLRVLYPDGKLRCESCDPELESKLRELNSGPVRKAGYVPW